ncbi:hypothetical protein HJG60_011501 [Phyllostomus discolor]|uniref:Uncharacterized protein n=1 Tax=Phyllostomus discolor TaxID=89673 RepID=A0A833ZVW6_9CHIR|nr:hypothetical protein HJG60_011501 [Phyllostomus discolor]
MMDQTHKDSNVRHHLKDRQKASAFSFSHSFPLLSIFFYVLFFIFAQAFLFLSLFIFYHFFLLLVFPFIYLFIYLLIYLLTYLFAFSDYTYASLVPKRSISRNPCYPVSFSHCHPTIFVSNSFLLLFVPPISLSLIT